MRQTITNKTTNNNPKSLKNKFIIPLLLLSLALIFSFTAGAVSASSTSTTSGSDVIYVNDTGGNDDNNGTSWQWAKKSIKNATGTVNANGTVNIANGLYKGVNNTGITIDKSMIIKGQGQTGTIINGSNSTQIFYILSGVSVTIKNLTVANGNNTGDMGGAIYNAGNLTISGCKFTDNTADYGGAVFNDGNLIVSDCKFTGNTAQLYGGAITNGGNLTVSDSIFTGNVAQDASWSVGGAIYNYGSSTISGSTFAGNTAANGGAINNQGNGMTISGSTFTNNTSKKGGAINNYYDNLSVTNCTFTGNIATGTGSNDGGAAIFSDGGTLNVTNSTFKDNDAAASDSAAIYNYGGTLKVMGSTFTGNEGGAIVNDNNGTLNVTNSTFTCNHAIYDGGAIWNWGTLTVNFCRIVGNTANGDGDAIYNYNEQPVNVENNWWGSNNPNFDSLISGMPRPNYWIYMTLTANPTTIKNGKTSLITVSFNNLFNGEILTDLDPATGHIPDGSPVNFQTDLGTIGCKSIDKTTIGGIATATLTATELAGTAHVNATTDNQTLFVNVTITPKAGLYLTVTPSKLNPVAGDTVLYTLKVGNNGPDAAKDVVMTYVVPEGLEFAGATVDVGTYIYDPVTRTITWAIGDVPVGDPYMWLSLRVAQSGHYLINPVLITSTYDPTITIDTQSITVNAAAQDNQNTPTNPTKVNAASKTIPLQKTGLPLAGLVLAVLAVFGGLVPKRK